MPDVLYRLSEIEAGILGITTEFGASASLDDVWLARGPHTSRDQPAATINWSLVEKAASKLSGETQGFARILLAAREDGRDEHRTEINPPAVQQQGHLIDDFVEQFFIGPDHTYFCDSYDPQQGFWMTRIDCPPENIKDEHSKWRRNISENAINRIYHRIYCDLDGNSYSTFGPYKGPALIRPVTS